MFEDETRASLNFRVSPGLFARLEPLFFISLFLAFYFTVSLTSCAGTRMHGCEKKNIRKRLSLRGIYLCMCALVSSTSRYSYNYDSWESFFQTQTRRQHVNRCDMCNKSQICSQRHRDPLRRWNDENGLKKLNEDEFFSHRWSEQNFDFLHSTKSSENFKILWEKKILSRHKLFRSVFRWWKISRLIM